MALYQFRKGGIFNTATKVFTPENSTHKTWRAYQRWLAKGNTPDPVEPTLAPPPKPVLSLPGPSDNSVPALKIKVTEIIQVLQSKGFITTEVIP